MFNTDFIGIYDNALSSYHCKEIIKWIEKQDLVKGITGGGEGSRVDISKKDSWEVYGPTFDNNTYVSQLIKDSIYKHTPLYKEKWSREMYCIKNGMYIIIIIYKNMILVEDIIYFIVNRMLVHLMMLREECQYG